MALKTKQCLYCGESFETHKEEDYCSEECEILASCSEIHTN